MKTKTKTILFLSMLIIGIGFTACKKDSPVVETVITEEVFFLDAQADSTWYAGPMGLMHIGPYTKFSFSEGGIVEGDNWDIAFRNSKILVNGGVGESMDPEQPNRTGQAAAYIKSNTSMADITSVNEDLLMQDGDNNLSFYGTTAIIDDQGQEGLGWSIYDEGDVLGTPPIWPELKPEAGKILVFRTHDGNHYAKMEILNFYSDGWTPNSPFPSFGGVYSFNYVYQSEEGNTTF